MDGTSITLHDMQLIIFCFISLILNQAYGNSMAPSPTFTDLLSEKMQKDPFSLIAMCLFLGAIFHTFLTSKLSNIAKQMETNLGHASWKSSVLKLLGEVEIVFANQAKAILDYTDTVINCDIHTRARTKRMLLAAGARKVCGLDELGRHRTLF